MIKNINKDIFIYINNRANDMSEGFVMIELQISTIQIIGEYKLLFLKNNSYHD